MVCFGVWVGCVVGGSLPGTRFGLGLRLGHSPAQYRVPRGSYCRHMKGSTTPHVGFISVGGLS